MRLLGAVMALIACGAMGFIYNRSLRERLDTLAAMYEVLAMMKLELSNRICALPELIETLSERSKGEVSDFLLAVYKRLSSLGEYSFDELWCECAAKSLTALNENERRAICSLGSILGRGELDAQIAEIDRCTSTLHTALENARTEQPQQKKLTLGMSFAAGMLLVIMLI